MLQKLQRVIFVKWMNDAKLVPVTETADGEVGSADGECKNKALVKTRCDVS